MIRLVKLNESVATKRRVYLFINSSADPNQPSDDEAGLQPGVSIDGATPVGAGTISTLTKIVIGVYYADIAQSVLDTEGKMFVPTLVSPTGILRVSTSLLVTTHNPMDNDVTKFNGSATAAVRLALSAARIFIGTVDTSTFTSTTTQFETADIAEPEADLYKNCMGLFTSGALATKNVRFKVTGYSKVGSKGRFVVSILDGSTALPSAPANGVTFIVV